MTNETTFPEVTIAPTISIEELSKAIEELKARGYSSEIKMEILAQDMSAAIDLEEMIQNEMPMIGIDIGEPDFGGIYGNIYIPIPESLPELQELIGTVLTACRDHCCLISQVNVRTLGTYLQEYHELMGLEYGNYDEDFADAVWEYVRRDPEAPKDALFLSFYVAAKNGKDLLVDRIPGAKYVLSCNDMRPPQPNVAPKDWKNVTANVKVSEMLFTEADVKAAVRAFADYCEANKCEIMDLRPYGEAKHD